MYLFNGICNKYSRACCENDIEAIFFQICNKPHMGLRDVHTIIERGIHNLYIYTCNVYLY